MVFLSTGARKGIRKDSSLVSTPIVARSKKLSEKIYRKPAKGGLLNVLLVQAAVENLPEELEGIASEVLVQFPWGSLLRGVAARDAVVMSNLRRACLPNALLQVTLGLDLERDRCEWERLELPAITIDYARGS